MALLHLGVLALHHRHPLPVRALRFHQKAVLGRREFFDRDARLDLLAAHHAFVVVSPGLVLHGSLGDARHRHARVIYAVVRVHLLFRAVTEDADALAWSHRGLPLGATNHAVMPFKPLAVVRRRHLSTGTHRARLHLTRAGPLADEVPEPLVLGAWLGRGRRLTGCELGATH